MAKFAVALPPSHTITGFIMSKTPQQPDRMVAGWTRSGSPYHAGEQTLQAQAGARELAERAGLKGIRDYMPDQHRQFFAELSYIFIGSLDRAGRPWASILFGAPGFVCSPHDRRLDIAAAPICSDPLGDNLRPGAAIAVLGIQLETRRRNRMNGRVIERDAGRFAIGVDQSFGNCPKYIQARSVQAPGDASSGNAGAVARAETRLLSTEASAIVTRADTFFIATASAHVGGTDPVEGADVSHRGGRPGFVEVREENGRSVITAPDFAGNSFFSTFGNILVNPKAGLLFLDFATGDVLMLTGAAEVFWNAPELERFPGALRFLHVRVDEGLFIAKALPLRWSPPESAHQIAATGTWAEAGSAAAAGDRT
jgi:predicted pyridoxine 5'-phosphate oxidase superfamily flavin-nucleotide-binding protein